MIKATFFTGSVYLNNRQFDITDPVFNINDCLYGCYLLKKRLEEKGIDLSTQDINPPDETSFIIYNDMPALKDIEVGKVNYLLLLESKIVKPDNWNIENHKYFKKIFTWDDTLIDNKKYFKINYSYKIPKELNFNLSEKKKLCVMINSNKFSDHPLELYTERIRAINWFEKNHPEDFDLYGAGWDKYIFKGGLKKLNRVEIVSKMLAPRHKCLRFPAPSKTILPGYKFAICYENARDIPGYITEKIFNCFFSGCVPIYLGAPNVTDYIPPETFIDKRNFKTYEELYSYIKNMPDTEYIDYLNAIKNFVLSDRIYPFSAECFVETLVREIIDNK